DARIEWSAPAVAIDRLVRACTPAPGAWTTFRGERFKVAPVRVKTEVATLKPGEISAGKREVLVGTGTVPVQLSDVRPQGKQQMEAAAWARGVRIADGEHFGEEA
ncbi:MAG: methionyl-tRNA formyltransferase, partial [Thermocrispum sp.]